MSWDRKFVDDYYCEVVNGVICRPPRLSLGSGLILYNFLDPYHALKDIYWLSLITLRDTNMSFGSPGCFSMVSLSSSFRFPDFCKAAWMVWLFSSVFLLEVSLLHKFLDNEVLQTSSPFPPQEKF